MTLLGAYDIADDRRRADVVRVLLDYGSRVQESVFWLDVDQELRDRMEKRLRKAIDPEEDVLWIVPVCGSCVERMTLLGKTRKPETPAFWIV